MRILLSIASLALIAGTAAAQQYSNEANTYRYGGTYNTVPASSASNCASICGQDQACQAWSFQSASRGLGQARCELKSTIGRAVSNPLMISGINPRIANQGQTAQRRIPSTSVLLGGPNSTSPRTVVRNRTASTTTTIRRTIVPPPSIEQITRPPIPVRQAAPSPAPVRQAAPSPAPVRQAAPSPAPVSPIAPTSAPIRQAAPVAQPSTLQPGEFVSPTAAKGAPAPAPIRNATTTTLPQTATPAAINSSERIDVPVTQPELPTGSVLRQAPPPQISFRPLSTTPTAPPPASDASTAPAETITLPRSRNTAKQPTSFNTVPAGSVPAPAATPAQPYNNLRNREFPDFSVNRPTVLTPDELAAQNAAEQASPETIDKVVIDGIDLASDIGQPIDPNRTNTVPSGGGGS